MAPHVEDARDRLVAMNRPVPEPSAAAIAESDAEERSRTPLHFSDVTLDIIRRGPTVVEAAHVGDPTLVDPTRTLAPDVTKENVALFKAAYEAGRPPAPVTAAAPAGANEPPRSDSPSNAPLQMAPPAAGSAPLGAQIISAPNSSTADPNAVVQPVGPTNTALPPVENATQAPLQQNEVKPGEAPSTQPAANANSKKKAPKADLSDESSSKKKKKKGLAKINPF
jgi:outer membrane protein assembly factor BamD